ncbi:MAG: lactonase family protein [Gammaproteobacteria bacterium]|nr:lactonase family protein [Gammaproteobacteria bacterium]MDH5800822.1 lactonase family protein [Gammaproteobacteria bacterium]
MKAVLVANQARRFPGLVFILCCICTSVLAEPQARFAYSVNSVDNSITAYRINEYGIPVYNSHMHGGKFPSSVAIHPGGKFLVTTSQIRNRIQVYSIDSKTGEIAKHGAPVDDKSLSIFDSDFTPAGEFLYVAGRISNTISAYRFDAVTGRLTSISGSPFKTPGRPRQLLIHPSGRFLFTLGVFDDTVSVFSIDEKSGELTLVQKSSVGVAPMSIKMDFYEQPEYTKSAPYNLALDAEGKVLYVANWVSASISAFLVDTHTGKLTVVPGSPFITEAHPYSVIVDKSGRYVYSAHWASDKIILYKREANGALQRVAGAEVTAKGQAPVDLWIDPSQRLLYVTNYVSHNISVFERDMSNGRLRFKDAYTTRNNPRKLAFLTGNTPVRIQSDALFVLDKRFNKIQAYRLQQGVPQTGTRSEQVVKGKPVALSYDREHALVYVLTQNPNQLLVFRYDVQKHDLRPLSNSTLALQWEAEAVTTGVTGRFVYVANTSQGHMSVFEYDADKNRLQSWPESPFVSDPGPAALRMGSDEKIMYSVNTKNNTISAFMFGEGDAPTPLIRNLIRSEFIFKTGAEPKDIVFDVGGKFAYVANYGDDSLSPYWVHQHNGKLTQIRLPGYSAGKGPISLAMHPGNRFLYVVNRKESTVSVFDMDPTNGIITERKRVKTGKTPIKIRLDDGGRYAYVVYENSAVMSVFSINDTGKLLKLKDVTLPGIVADFVLHQRIAATQ